MKEPIFVQMPKGGKTAQLFNSIEKSVEEQLTPEYLRPTETNAVEEFLQEKITQVGKAEDYGLIDPSEAKTFPELTANQKAAIGPDAVKIYNLVKDYKENTDPNAAWDWIGVAKDAKLLTKAQIDDMGLDNPDIPLEEKTNIINNIKNMLIGSGEQIFFEVQLADRREFNGMMPFELGRNYFLRNDETFKFNPEKEEFEDEQTLYSIAYRESLYLVAIKELVQTDEFYNRIEKELKDRLYPRTIKRTTETIRQISDKKRTSVAKKTANRDTTDLDRNIRILFPEATKNQSRAFVYAMSKCFTKKNTLVAALSCYLINANILSLMPILAYMKDESELAGSARILAENLQEVMTIIAKHIK